MRFFGFHFGNKKNAFFIFFYGYITINRLKMKKKVGVFFARVETFGNAF